MSIVLDLPTMWETFLKREGPGGVLEKNGGRVGRMRDPMLSEARFGWAATAADRASQSSALSPPSRQVRRCAGGRRGTRAVRPRRIRDDLVAFDIHPRAPTKRDEAFSSQTF